MSQARPIQIVEVAPRDGLQNEPVALDARAKVALIEHAFAAGIRRIEVTAFVHPERVPAMADAERVCAALAPPPGVTTTALVANQRGLERAAAAGIGEINAVVVVTDTFSERNQGIGTDAAIEAWHQIAQEARALGITPTVTLGASFGCPFDGPVPLERLTDVAGRVAQAAPAEIALADTIGVAVPTEVRRRFEAVAAAAPAIPLRAHLHNTRNTGYANAVAAIEAGARALDASLGGIGGCPFAPRATGNIATEDLVYLLEGMGLDTGVSLERLLEAAGWLEHVLGRPVPGLVSKAGPFPQPAVRV